MGSASSSSLAAREKCILGRELNTDCMAGCRRFCTQLVFRDRSHTACTSETCSFADPVVRPGPVARETSVLDHCGRCRNRWAKPIVGRGHNGSECPWRRRSEVGSQVSVQYSTVAKCRGAAPCCSLPGQILVRAWYSERRTVQCKSGDVRLSRNFAFPLQSP